MPNVPPSKKLKQTDLLSSFQQSRKKQTTTRDSESGETSQARDNVQMDDSSDSEKDSACHFYKSAHPTVMDVISDSEEETCRSTSPEHSVIHGADKNMPKEPPKKKLKQTDLQSSSQQSPKKQTARDDESGETSKASDNIQKTMDHLCKKEVEEGPSKHLKQERMDDLWEKEAKVGESKYDVQQNSQKKRHFFQFRFKNNTYTVTCDTSMTVLEALSTSNIFKTVRLDFPAKTKTEIKHPAIKQ